MSAKIVMDLREKLDRLKAAKRQRTSATPPDASRAGAAPARRDPSEEKNAARRQLFEKLGDSLFRASDLLTRADEPPRLGKADAVTVLENAERVETPHGPAVRVEHRLSLDPEAIPQPGSGDAKYRFPFRVAAAETTGEDMALLARDPAFASMSLKDLAFLDLETTGLAGGAGTYAFLVGVGWFEDDAFVVEQWFMDDYDQEAPVMEAVAERLRERRALVTYNGKKFDAPLLKTRFLFNRVAHDLDGPNLDLLHPARRVWKQALPDCRLSTIEERVLRLGGREEDVSGALVPRIYFDYVRGVRPERMRPVLHHNAQDIVSLASLMGLLARLTREPEQAALDHPLELLGLARLVEASGRVEAALECMERSLLTARDSRLIFQISWRIARLYKKQERFDEAAEIWESHTSRPEPHSVPAFIELAKHLEHRLKDFERGLEVAERARLYCAEQSGLLADMGRRDDAARLRRWLDDLERRVERLARKRGREAGGALALGKGPAR